MLNPADPIDLAAMLEVDALTPEAPSMLPAEEVARRFIELEKREVARLERDAEAKRVEYRRQQRRHWLLVDKLGANYRPLPAAEVWVNDAGESVTGAQLCRAEGKGHW